MTRSRAFFPMAAFLSLSGVASPADAQIEATDSATVVASVQAFGQALEEGDTAAVRALLADDVLIAESGSVETREEYLAHHLPADMAFAAAVHQIQESAHIAVSAMSPG